MRCILYFAKDNDHGLGELIVNRLKEKGAVEIEDYKFQEELV